MTEVSNTPFNPKTYGVQVGSLWVAIDFEAQAVAITRRNRPTRPVNTEQLDPGLLIDRNVDGDICCVEVIG